MYAVVQVGEEGPVRNIHRTELRPVHDRIQPQTVPVLETEDLGLPSQNIEHADW